MKYDEDYLRIRISQLRQMKNIVSSITDEIENNYKGRAIGLNENHPNYEQYYDLIYRKNKSYPEFVRVPEGNPFSVTIKFVDYSNGAARTWNVPPDAIKLLE